MIIVRVLCLLLAWVATAELSAQVMLVPSDRAPYRQKFDLQLPDAQYLFLQQSAGSLGEGPYQFRFRNEALNQLLEHPSTVRYITSREGGVHLQVLHLRADTVPESALGRQDFEVLNATGDVAGRGTMLVLARLPEALEIVPEGDARVLEVGRATPVRLRVRGHGNFRGDVRVVNPRDWELSGLRQEPVDSLGTIEVRGVLRALRPEASELRLALQTEDGRTAEIAFPSLPVRAPTPQRVRMSGGPLYLDRLGRGSTRIRIAGLPNPISAAEIVNDPAGELVVSNPRPDAATGELQARVEFMPRTARGAGMREIREITVRSGAQIFRGYLEVIGAPSVAAARTDRTGTAALPIGSAPTLLRISGQNLDEFRLDCTPLGRDAVCRNVGSTPTEILEEVVLGPEVREGDVLLPLTPTGARARTGNSAGDGLAVRVQVDRPSLPTPLARTNMIRLACDRLRSCRWDRSGESVAVSTSDAPQLRLLLNDTAVGPEHGWQKLIVGVTRVRGEQRQAVRSIGTSAAPRLLRWGSGGGELPLLDVSADPRHGDMFIVRVEHAAEQYPVEYRSAATGEAWVLRIYVDGGLARRITGDIAVQPVLFAMSGGETVPMYPNAGFGVTWQFLNERLEPRLFSAKLQLIATDIKKVGAAENASRPAFFLSGNLRIPGTDPARPLVLTSGVAHMLTGEERWRLLAGAGIDLGVARLIFGG